MCIPPPHPLPFWQFLSFGSVCYSFTSQNYQKPIIQSTYEGLIQFWTHPYPLIHHQLVGVNCDLESNLHWRLLADVTSYHQCKSLFNTDTTLFWVLLECEAIKVSIRSYSRQRHCCLSFSFAYLPSECKCVDIQGSVNIQGASTRQSGNQFTPLPLLLIEWLIHQ